MGKAIERISVIGGGIMGSGIAQVAANAGFQVTVFDVSAQAADRCRATIAGSLERFMKKGTLDAAQVKVIQERIGYTVELSEATSGADYVCEAIVEDLQAKKELFAQLDEMCRPDTILASNTSQFSITAIASATKNRERVIGTHYFNPAVLMKLVEVIRGLDTSDETVRIVKEVNESCGKEVVVCQKDSPGFITTRLTAIQRAEAYRIYEEGIASIEDIDKAMRLAFNHPMGPFQLADFAGLDTGLRALGGLAEAYGERFRPTPALKQMVDAGYLGRKVGRGFYRYDIDWGEK